MTDGTFPRAKTLVPECWMKCLLPTFNNISTTAIDIWMPIGQYT